MFKLIARIFFAPLLIVLEFLT